MGRYGQEIDKISDIKEAEEELNELRVIGEL
jgi:hypothetical protein